MAPSATGPSGTIPNGPRLSRSWPEHDARPYRSRTDLVWLWLDDEVAESKGIGILGTVAIHWAVATNSAQTPMAP